MRNDRLRDAMLARRVSAAMLADELGVDPKTVERWVTKARAPYPRHRAAIAARLGEQERYLWPSVDAKSLPLAESEIVKVYPHRSAVPTDLWDKLFAQAVDAIDILVYVGMFMTEKPNLPSDLTSKAEQGVKIRLLFGDRDSIAVAQRSIDEGIGQYTIAAKIDHALAHFDRLQLVDGIEIRVHDTVLYNSLYRFDSDMIVNPHVYGRTASHAPALHLHTSGRGEMFETYAASFDDVWLGSKQIERSV